MKEKLEQWRNSFYLFVANMHTLEYIVLCIVFALLIGGLAV